LQMFETVVVEKHGSEWFGECATLWADRMCVPCVDAVLNAASCLAKATLAALWVC
jgi:hypothetical protein